MRATKNSITVERFYIYNGDGKVKYFNTIDELVKGIDFITEHGYNAIGVDYSIPNSFPGSKDILVKYEEDASFDISNDINVINADYKDEILDLAYVVKKSLYR